jgi:DNA-binding XRE family transcriptional regulator
VIRFSPAKLRALREQAGLSRNALAFAIGRAPDSVRDCEYGRYVPNGDSMFALTQVLSCTLNDFAEDPNDG